nr:general transcription factor 3C polypeptide 2-like [Nerophis lumbriciformis]XP_061785848.1 general transcription factor 3C polypeptide 2-like [Nerophis lumbriciformis]XP_061785849.1 general transcription factor 3C polypeptide 2-like [Nerophis lumbriciformis]XP_061785850.1 general transcription factor 3C polypeptide 2-like [Nerophis lumbriciformis]XP_061785851.1 general transcription factor 3C polypeptide 2-like [Nerophis lumbriciformis]
MKETLPVDADDPEQGGKTPSTSLFDLTPSSRGRQRRKNPRFSDYDTSDIYENEAQSEKEISATKSLEKKATPKKRGRPRKVPLPSVDEQAASESPRVPEAKRTPLNNTPATANDCASPAPGDPLENGTPKPKRKYLKKQRVEVEPVAPSPREKSPEVPEEEVLEGRCKRSAAKMAMKFLHAMAQDISHSTEGPKSSDDSITKTPEQATEDRSSKEKKVRRGWKRKHSDSDAAEDVDFVPDVEEEEVENAEEDDEESTDSDFNYKSCHSASNTKLGKNSATIIMNPIWDAFDTYKSFREENLSTWIFPEWMPSSSAWHQVSQSELETYLPQELLSAAFKVSRESYAEETPLRRLKRFEALPSHQDRWDLHLNAGGPVWAMEWCPTPDGAVASQYLAVACYRNMDDQHYLHKTYSGPALVQLWDLGLLEYDSRPGSQPRLAYGVVLDKGFIWHLKWCPAGGWEMPSKKKQAPLLPRLGLLAVATSTAVVTIYSLPHPDALNPSWNLPDYGDSSQCGAIYKPDPVLTLKLGSLKSLRLEQSGQVLSMDWLPVQPHDVIAIGFYDGIVGLWDLNTKSPLLRVQVSHDSLTLLPFKCFLAHDNAVRALVFCPANRHLLASAGEDRFLKTWDLTRPYGPVTVQKRSVPSEVYWPLNATGLFWAEDNAFVSTFSQGVHYYDHKMCSYFAIPRMITMWSISYSDWLNSVVTSDVLGEVICAALPPISIAIHYPKRPVERRFPIYFTTVEPHEDTGKKQDGPADAGCEEEEDEEVEGEKGRKVNVPHLQPETYKEAERKYYLHYTDNNMIFGRKGCLWKKMQKNEFKSRVNVDRMPLSALHKVRLNPNMSSHTWLASAGQAGLVRLNCVRSLNNSYVHAAISKCQAEFDALHPSTSVGEEQKRAEDAPL